MRTHGSSTAVNVSFDSKSCRTNFFSPTFFFSSSLARTLVHNNHSLLDFSALHPLIPFLACWALLRLTDWDSF